MGRRSAGIARSRVARQSRRRTCSTSVNPASSFGPRRPGTRDTSRHNAGSIAGNSASASGREVDLRQAERVGERHGGPVDLGPARHHHFAGGALGRDRLRARRVRPRAWRHARRRPAASRAGSRDTTTRWRPGRGRPSETNVLRPMITGLPRVSALKWPQVARHPPRQAVTQPDGAVAPDRRDQHDRHGHDRVSAEPPAASRARASPSRRHPVQSSCSSAPSPR